MSDDDDTDGEPVKEAGTPFPSKKDDDDDDGRGGGASASGAVRDPVVTCPGTGFS